MSLYILKLSSRFKSDYKRFKNNKRFIKEFEKVIDLLENGKKLEKKYHDHNLEGKLSNLRECHIFPDILLIYKLSDKELILQLLRVGSHSEIF
ncbi:MAG: type II toxin-antitoxin system YafQ family toxin [Candidatus Gracilibacteria bacterium]|nr:type II toxin-antitoxin system YafQ family toxin [Candidatus Gracilibacteria bacterium]MDD2908791.1 type II toxin-antitoxin system YafQ family toxin [Candidatus Gracilibacteria bacterium]